MNVKKILLISLMGLGLAIQLSAAEQAKSSGDFPLIIEGRCSNLCDSIGLTNLDTRCSVTRDAGAGLTYETTITCGDYLQPSSDDLLDAMHENHLLGIEMK